MNGVSSVSYADLRLERDRFAAFALAAADALVETDTDLNIRYATGALKWLFGKDFSAEKGSNLERFIAPDNSKLFAAACKLGRKEGRFGMLDMTFRHSGGQLLPAQISCTFLPRDGGRFYFALRGRAPTAPAPTQSANPEVQVERDPGKHAETISQIADNARADGRDLDLTLLSLNGLNELRQRLAPEAAAELMADVEAQLNSRSLAGSSVTQIGDDAFSIIHERGMNTDSLAGDLSHCADEYGDGEGGLEVRKSTIDISSNQLTEAEMAKALVYSITKFTESKGEFTVNDLNEGYKAVLADAEQRIADLKETIKVRAFDLAYQPIVDLASGEVHHHEALVRFRQDGPDRSPFETITFAEEVDLIAPLDLAICERAVDTLRDARRAGSSLSLAVNVSGRSLETPIFLERLSNLLKNCKDISDQLLFEVTESSKIANLESTNNFLQSVRSLGHAVCLDDFGAGASAFQYLRNLSVDYVKIDGVYIRDLVGDSEKQAFVRSMVTLCRDLKIETVAEMIEDEATVDLLKQAGVIYGQGYFFGKPTMERPD